MMLPLLAPPCPLPPWCQVNFSLEKSLEMDPRGCFLTSPDFASMSEHGRPGCGSFASILCGNNYFYTYIIDLGSHSVCPQLQNCSSSGGYGEYKLTFGKKRTDTCCFKILSILYLFNTPSATNSNKSERTGKKSYNHPHYQYVLRT